MKKKIIIKPVADDADIKKLQEALSIDHVLANLLAQRGIKTYDEAKAFFRPEYENLHDPFLMQDMEKAVSRLDKAIANNEKILIYGDYDVDGTTSVALVYSFLRDIYNSLDFYIPNRYNEGYGISHKGIDYAKETGATLVIALDCGIKAVEKIEYATNNSIDFIICDHHTPGDTIPEAVAVLDPKRKDCEYPYKELSGCGVGFKFMQAFADRKNIPFKNLVKYIDLVVVSIASDIVDITGENRVLAYFGLKKLNEDPVIGLKAIIKIAGQENKTLTISDCVFKIGPRINAAGRIESGKYAVELMVSGDMEKAKEVGRKIDEYNTERKSFDRNITHEALRTIGNDITLRNQKSTVLYNPDWHKGVVGIVASRLTETYYRPTIILTESKGMATGSARSVSDFDLYSAINSCNKYLVNFGGHKFAAGLTIKIDDVDKFSECFEKYVSENITDKQKVPVVEVDSELEFSQISPKFYRILRQFAPFGPGNMTPIFLTKNIKDTGKTACVGRTKEHLKLEMIDKEKNTLSGIAFSLGHVYSQINDNKTFAVCYSIEENEFRGKVNLQAMVKEIQVEDIFLK